jgi:hypothetical protein
MAGVGFAPAAGSGIPGDGTQVPVGGGCGRGTVKADPSS